MHNVPSYFLWSALTSCLAVAQSPFHARPERVSSGAFPGETVPPSSNGIGGTTMSPDGRILVHTRLLNESLSFGWQVNCFRPEAVDTDTRGIAVFQQSIASPPSGPWSDKEHLEFQVTQPPIGQHTSGNTQFSKQTLTMCPNPHHRDKSCPFPSDVNGVPGQPGTVNGAYDTYLMMVVAPDEWQHVNPSPNNDVDWPTFNPPSIGGVKVNPIGMRFLRVTVQNPRTLIATPIPSSPADPLLDRDFKVLKWTSTTYGENPVLGIEPSISLDGRLLVFQGNPSNNTRKWNSADTEGDRIMYTFNPTPGVATGWSMPRPINEMFLHEQGTTINGVSFARLYPIAAAAMTTGDGQPLPNQPIPFAFPGAYPWITLDATDIVFSAIYNPGIDSRRYAMSIVGRSTGYSVRHIDGPLNPDRFTTRRVITAGTGAAPGIWAWGGDTPGLNLPYTRLGTSISLLNMQNREYAEICVNEAVDRDYLLAWDMNEFVKAHPPSQPGGTDSDWLYDFTRTPDTSGHGIAGTLLSDATQFRQDVPLGDPGASGEFILCFDLGWVAAEDPTALLNASLPAITAECWFWCTPDGQPFSLIHKAGAYELAADRQGRVTAQVTIMSGTGIVQSPPWLGAPLGVGQWRHVAMTYDSVAG